ncbi:hypothetical protein [Aquimarina algiphila]|uniref:hypothetical protein n=1 Tax=Aquimarina algiphila TaxID=2047982 RepID=UPI00232DF4B0|nr:hypothetical protein [Aquimarina algiphila]
MKNSILNLGKVLTKEQQRNVTGGDGDDVICDDRHCWKGTADKMMIQRADGTYVA